MEDPIELIRCNKRTTDEENTCHVSEPVNYTWYIIGVFAIIIVLIIIIVVTYMRSNTSTDEALQKNLQDRFGQAQLRPQVPPVAQSSNTNPSHDTPPPFVPISQTPVAASITEERNNRRKELLDQEEKLKALITGAPIITPEEVKATSDDIQDELDSTKKSTLTQQDDDDNALIDSIFKD